MTKPTVVYWNNIPSPYVVGRFDAIARRGNIDFESWFNEPREADRSWDVQEDRWQFRAHYLSRTLFAGRSLSLPLRELRERPPQLLVSLFSTPSFILGSLMANSAGSRVAYRVLPTFDSWQKRTNLREVTKHGLFHIVDGVKVSGPAGAETAMKYGVPAGRVFPVTQSIDVEHYSRALTMTNLERERRRAQLKLHGTVYLYVGRLWKLKGLDYLLNAYAEVRQSIPDSSLLIIGDGVDGEYFRSRTQHVPGVTLAGFVQPADLPEFYALADIFVFPTLGDPHGLVVEEAMAAGLAVISSAAAGDIERRLPEGKAGFIVPPADTSVMAQRMVQLGREPGRRHEMAQVGNRLVRFRSHEQYAEDFEEFVGTIMSLPRRQGAAPTVGRWAGAALHSATRLVSTDPFHKGIKRTGQ